MPVRTAADFVDLAVLCDAADSRPVLSMISGTIAEALADDELRALSRTLAHLKHTCETELAARHTQRRLQ